MDPFEKYDMTFNGAVRTRMPTTSPGRYAGYDNGWALSLLIPVLIEFDKSIVDFPNIKRFPGGASNDLVPNLRIRRIQCRRLTRRIRQRSETRGEARPVAETKPFPKRENQSNKTNR